MYHTTTENERLLDDVPIWVRYGHTRKPNWVVLKLYGLFDLITDFFPMFSALFRFIRNMIVGTWGLLVRFVLTVVNIALLVGIICVSVEHSYEFLTTRAGMSGVYAWILVGVWETMFIYCSTLIDFKHRKGKKSNWADWTGFLMGWAFVEVTNFMGMADNVYGKAVGLATPVILLVMKKVLEKQFINDTQKKQSWLSSFFVWIVSLFQRKTSTEKQPQIQPQMVERPTEKTVADPVENAVEADAISGSKSGSETVENAVENLVENLPQNRIEPVVDPVEKVVAEAVEEAVESATEKGDEKAEETAEKTVEKSTTNAVEEPTGKVDEKQPVEMAQTPVVSTDSADIEATENDTVLAEEKEAITTEKTVGEAVEKAVAKTVENATEFPVENDAEKDQKTNRDPVEKATANEEEKVATEDQKTVEQPTKKVTKRKLKKDGSSLKLNRSIKRWALDYFQKNGKPPGRVIIEKEFGMNQNQARLVANEIKKELGIKAS